MEKISKQKLKDIILKNLNANNIPVTPQLIGKIDSEIEKTMNKINSI